MAPSFPLPLPCVVARKRGERLGEVMAAPLLAVPLATGGGATERASLIAPPGRISPRASWSCCCNDMVELAICSQPGSKRPDSLDFDQDTTGRALPNGVVERPLKCPRSPSVTEADELVMSARTSGIRLRPCCPKKARLRCTNWIKRRSTCCWKLGDVTSMRLKMLKSNALRNVHTSWRLPRSTGRIRSVLVR